MVRGIALDSVLITGVNGFIGSALCAKMLFDGWTVRGTVRNAQHSNLLPPNLEPIIIESIGSDIDWSKALNGVDSVVHLAALIHLKDNSGADQFRKFRYINTVATEHLARTAATSGCRRFIFLSSVKVNGEEKAKPYTEKDIPKPIDPYGISKWEAEKLLHKISAETGMEVVIIRPPMVYGPNVKANFLLLFKVVERGIPLPMTSINNRRSFIYLGNLIDAVVTCIKHPKASGQTYFVSDGEDVSTPELIQRISYSLGKPTRLFPFPPVMLKIAGIITGKTVTIDRLLHSFSIDCSKISNELNWKAPFTMEQGLRETAQWYKERRQKSGVRDQKLVT